MKDSKTEYFLTANGYTWQFHKELPLDQLDMKEAESNPARLGSALDEDYALGIGLAVQEGADLPAIVVLDDGTALYKIVTGRHRINGVTDFCKPPRPALDAYVVREVDPYRIQLLIRTINVIEGHAPDTRERLTHIAEMRRMFPHSTAKELAALFRVATNTAAEYLRVIAMERRAEDLGIGNIAKSRTIPMKLKAQLQGLQNDNIFLHAVTMVSRHPNDFRGKTPGETLVKELRSAGSERKALKYLDERDRELTDAEDQRKVKKSRSPSGKATLFVGAARSLLKKYPGSPNKLYLEGLGTTCNELKRELKVLREARNALDDVDEALVKLIADLERQEEWKQKSIAAARGSQPSDSISDRP